MDYTPDDYEALFGKEYQPKPWTLGRFMLLVVILGLILASWGVAGCDFQAAQATAESIKTADEANAAVMGMPCAWVAQCSNPVACPVSARKCVNTAQRTE